MPSPGPERDDGIDHLVRLATQAVCAPTVIVALERSEGHWQTAHAGATDSWLENGGKAFLQAVSDHFAHSDKLISVSDVFDAEDSATALLQDLDARSWAAVPIMLTNRRQVGVVCVFDTAPRTWTSKEIQGLYHVAALSVAVSEFGASARHEFSNPVETIDACSRSQDDDSVSKFAISNRTGNNFGTSNERWMFSPAQFEQRYQSLFSLNPDGVFSIDVEGNFTDGNPALEEIFGYSIEQLRGMPFAPLIVAEDVDKAVSAFQTALAGVENDWELAVHRRDGERRELRGTSIPMAIDGEIVGVFGVTQDVTERVRAEAMLRESEVTLRYQNSLLAALGEASADGFMVVSPEGKILSYNQRFMAMWGIPEEIMERGSILEARDAVLEKLVRPEAFVQRAEYLYHHPDEDSRDEVELKDGRIFERYSYPVITSDGAFLGRVWYYRDITEKKQAEQRLHEQTIHLESLVAHNPDLVARLDLEGCYLSINSAFRSILGYEDEDLIGQPFTAIVAPHDHAKVWQAIAQLAQGNPQSLEVTVHTRDGRSREISAQGVPIIVGDEVAGIWGIGKDITETKEIEDRLRHSEVRLNEAQRIAQLGNWGWDLQRNSLTWSEQTYRLFGIVPGSETPTFERFLELVHPDDRQNVLAAVETSLSDGAPYNIDITIVRDDGEQRIVNAQGEVTFGENGNPVRMAGTVLDVTERKWLEHELAYLATHDPLTGLFNRYHLNYQMEQILGHTPACQLGLLYIDLDDFKLVNDSMGHAAGDVLLQLVGERLSEVVRPDDIVARLGGDEFILLIHGGSDENGYVDIAERIIRSLKQPFLVHDSWVSISPSIGIVPEISALENPESILLSADHAMYNAKRQGKAQYEVFTSSMSKISRNLVKLRNELYTAVEREEFALHYQPIIGLDTGQPVGVEALIRWNSAVLGSVSPGEFIPIAERSGLIDQIGKWVIRAASQQAQEWNRHFPESNSLVMSINLSPAQIRQRTFVSDVERAMNDTGINPRNLCLELTETSMVSLDKSEIDRLRELRKHGIIIALDDFGTGNSSLSNLLDLPLDWLKVDRDFTKLLGQRAESNAILKAIVQLAHALDLKVIAEGIETAEQLEAITELGCDMAQGFYIRMPTSHEQAFQYLNSQSERNTHSTHPD